MAAAKRTKEKRAPAKRGRKPTRPRDAAKAPPETDPSRPLKNARHEAFAQDVFSGMTQADAYRSNYSCGGSSDKTVHVDASKLSAKVRPRIEWLQEQVASDRIVSREELAELYSEILRTRQSDFLTMSADGVWMHDIGAETVKQAALRKVKTRVVHDGTGNDVVAKQFDEIELESKVTTGKALAELLGYNAAKKHEVSGPAGGPVALLNQPGPPEPETLEEWQAMADAMLAVRARQGRSRGERPK